MGVSLMEEVFGRIRNVNAVIVFLTSHSANVAKPLKNSQMSPSLNTTPQNNAVDDSITGIKRSLRPVRTSQRCSLLEEVACTPKSLNHSIFAEYTLRSRQSVGIKGVIRRKIWRCGMSCGAFF